MTLISSPACLYAESEDEGNKNPIWVQSNKSSQISSESSGLPLYVQLMPVYIYSAYLHDLVINIAHARKHAFQHS